MFGIKIENIERRPNLSRRGAIKNTTIHGGLPATGLRPGACPAEKSVDLDTIVNHSDIENLVREVPGLELDRKEATVLGSDRSIVVVPGNYGKLLATVPDSTGSDLDPILSEPGPINDDISAIFYFEEWVPGVDDAWPQGTEARLIATDDELLLQRSATDAEKRQFLDEIDRPDLRGDDTSITVTPGRGDVHFTRADWDEGEIETVTGVCREGSVELVRRGEAGTGYAEPELQVVDETAYSPSDLASESEFSAAAECSDRLITISSGV